MRVMRPRYIEVVNTSDKDQILRDVTLPGGELIIRAGASLEIPAQTFLKVWRRNQAWLIRREKLDQQREAAHKAKEAEKAAAAAEADDATEAPKPKKVSGAKKSRRKN